MIDISKIADVCHSSLGRSPDYPNTPHYKTTLMNYIFIKGPMAEQLQVVKDIDFRTLDAIRLQIEQNVDRTNNFKDS